MRLIDADEIRWVDHYDSDGNLSKYKVAFSDEMPPTVDAVPVIRCKDCVYCRDTTDGTRKYCTSTGSLVNDGDFCAWAERKEE